MSFWYKFQNKICKTNLWEECVNGLILNKMRILLIFYDPGLIVVLLKFFKLFNDSVCQKLNFFIIFFCMNRKTGESYSYISLYLQNKWKTTLEEFWFQIVLFYQRYSLCSKLNSMLIYACFAFSCFWRSFTCFSISHSTHNEHHEDTYQSDDREDQYNTCAVWYTGMND